MRKMKKGELCNEIERLAGREMKTPRDFDWLSDLIAERTRERISASTLKRLWGYLNNDVQPRAFTVDVLARFVGYDSYSAFCERSGEAESNAVLSRRLAADELQIGQRVKLTWQPDRVCVVECLGEARFVVREAANTKLSVGDMFTCHLFIEREPLFLDHLVHRGCEATAYVAGRNHGIMFELQHAAG